MSTLPIPYISQRDEGRPINDCGPACALMVARGYGHALDTSIDDLYRWHNLPDTGLAVSTIMRLLSSLGVPCHRATGSLAQLRRWIDERTPPILLVDLYGGHFVVATGYHDGGFTMHDPYWFGDDGAHITISDTEMARIWGPHGNQYNWTAIVPASPLGDDMADIQKARAAIEAAHANLVQALEALEGDAPPPMPSPGPVLEVYGTGGATLRVRSAPNGPIIGALMPGQRVRELERRDGWVRHDAGGWSHGDYLRPT